MMGARHGLFKGLTPCLRVLVVATNAQFLSHEYALLHFSAPGNLLQASVLESSTTISSSVQSDYHLVDRLSGSKRLMYALFAGQKNHCFGEEDFKSYIRDALLAAHSSVVPVMGVESIVTLHKNNTIVQKNVPFGVEDLIELHSKESQDGQQNGGSSSNLALILGVVFGSVAAMCVLMGHLLRVCA